MISDMTAINIVVQSMAKSLILQGIHYWAVGGTIGLHGKAN